jgi:uncharacterized protein YbbC (DUF1343 family)
MLRGVEVLLFDMQDIGARPYTFVWTMAMAMEAAAAHGIRFIVLDRPNPITGQVEGPLMQREMRSVGQPITGYFPVPLRHGMTVGEVARYVNAEYGIGADLRVVPADGWRSGDWFDETGLPWINPSPNMRNFTEAILYPGIGLLEKALAVGRGTDTPFEVMGAPYIDDLVWARELNDHGLPGVRFVPVEFTPTASTFAGVACQGVYMLVTDRQVFRPVDAALLAASTLQRLYPQDFSMKDFNVLLLNPSLLDGIEAGKEVETLKGMWLEGLALFQERRHKYLLY